MNRRESVKFYMSVEGENCEKLYFEHLARIINRSGRNEYLNPINRYFSRNFVSLTEFKKESEFQKILDEYITLYSVFQAIERAKRIVEHNMEQGKVCEEYKKVKFYHDNPDTTVHDVVQLIFEVCGVK